MPTTPQKAPPAPASLRVSSGAGQGRLAAWAELPGAGPALLGTGWFQGLAGRRLPPSVGTGGRPRAGNESSRLQSTAQPSSGIFRAVALLTVDLVVGFGATGSQPAGAGSSPPAPGRAVGSSLDHRCVFAGLLRRSRPGGVRRGELASHSLISHQCQASSAGARPGRALPVEGTTLGQRSAGSQLQRPS